MKVQVELDISKEEWEAGLKTLSNECGSQDEKDLVEEVLSSSGFIPYMGAQTTGPMRFEVTKVKTEE